ncbi:putative MFS transporter [Xylariales sp. PMI_506]|nr:putative MFS transporter [Xylariales sp. PMI_506]
MSENEGSVTATDPGKAEQSSIFTGQGTLEDPFVVEFQKDDPGNPMNWSQPRKWFITSIVTLSVFAVTLTSSTYAGSSHEVLREFDISTETFTAGVSLFVLGFAIGPAVWGPLIIWLASHIAMVALIGGTAGSRNITTVLVLRFLSGTFGGAPIVNSGGAIADIFPPAQRGLAMTFYCIAPFLGPMLGPLIGGFVSESVGWRWVHAVSCIFIGVIARPICILGVVFVPETYGPVLLMKKANQLSEVDGKFYVSVLEKNQGKKTPAEVFKRALIRPWVFLFREPIVLVASIYTAIIYGTVYLFMGAMPIVYEEDRGWSEGIGGLAFMGIAVGIIIGVAYAVYDNEKRYMKLLIFKMATAESRLPPATIGAVALPLGMFAFAWTNFPSIHWSVGIILSAPFGIGCVLVLLPIINYLIDSYTIYAASVLAALAIFRSVVGAVFPLFTTQMYENLGIHWATSVPAFLTLACMPFPFVMYRYGETLRMKCKYAFEAAETMKRMQMQ